MCVAHLFLFKTYYYWVVIAEHIGGQLTNLGLR